ncbi:MAG: HD domain-containing protein [Patescibacteria group bacterium]
MIKEKSIESTIIFLKFLTKFQSIKRDLYAVGEERMENDAEHSYQLAMMGWFLNNELQLNLNNSRLIIYSLIHDLVEVHSGDTPVFTERTELLKSKNDRERIALDRIKKEFNKFPELAVQIESYSKMKDDESKFIKIVDKILPALNIYLDDFKTWQREKRNIAEWDLYITSKANIYPEVKDYILRIKNFIINKYKTQYGNVD